MSELMTRIPYNQMELADMIGVTQSAISHFINGRGFSLKIAHGFDVIAAVESGTALLAAKAVQQERFKRAKRRLARLGIDLDASLKAEQEKAEAEAEEKLILKPQPEPAVEETELATATE